MDEYNDDDGWLFIIGFVIMFIAMGLCSL